MQRTLSLSSSLKGSSSSFKLSLKCPAGMTTVKVRLYVTRSETNDDSQHAV